MKTVKRLFLAFAFLLLTFSLFSCAPAITLEEISAVLPELVDASKVLNEVYFGDGFKIDAEHSDVESSGGYYCCDTSDCEFHSILELKEATEKVFTKEYAEILYEAAFDGLSTDSVVKAPRFIETEEGLMQKANDEKYELSDRKFDYASAKKVKSNSKRIILTVDTYVDGEKDDTLTLIVARTGSDGSYVYRLDSPTY